MKQYLLSIYQPDGGPPPPDVLAKVMRNVTRVREEMQTAGVWVFGGGLHPPDTATVIRVDGGKTLKSDGAWLEGDEHLGGVTIIRAEDSEAALGWGRKLARATTLPVEVRAFQGEVDP
ncbi:MAG: YciI family protein [Chloroflexota bacterium]